MDKRRGVALSCSYKLINPSAASQELSESEAAPKFLVGRSIVCFTSFFTFFPFSIVVAFEGVTFFVYVATAEGRVNESVYPFSMSTCLWHLCLKQLRIAAIVVCLMVTL